MTRLILCLLLISTAVYADWTGNWTNEWNTANVSIATVSCSPDSFSITGNSSGYTVNYNFTTNLKNSSCLIGNVSQQYVSSNLTYNPDSNSWSDSLNQTLAFFITNETIAWTLCNGNNSACNISLAFQRVGSDPDQVFLFQSSYGTWLSPTPVNGSNQSSCNPPINVTVTDGSSSFGSNIVTFTFSNGSNQSQTASAVTSSTFGINWNLHNGMIITYSYNSTANQTYLQLQASESCIFSYNKLTGFFSGTYYPDWQNFQSSIYSSIEITIYNNTYMNLTTVSSKFGNSSDTLFEYSPSEYITAFSDEFYQYDSVADALFWNKTESGFLFTKNGSILPIDPFIGTWGNSFLLNSTDKAQECCAPDNMTITHSSDMVYAIDAVFRYSQETMNSQFCSNNKIYFYNNAVIIMEFTVDQPNPLQIFWSGPEGYVISLVNSSNWSQLSLTLNGKAGNCSVSMTQITIPNSSILRGISVFSLILSFIAMYGLI